MKAEQLKLFRIDERLIHGQGQLWIRLCGANTIVVANDEVAKDPIQQKIMLTAIPKEKDVRFYSIERLIQASEKVSDQRTFFIVVKDLKDAYELRKGGLPIEEMNIGNIHRSEGKEKVTNSIYIGANDKEYIKKLHDEFSMKFNTKTTPQGGDGSKLVDILEYI